jgi:uncharacterized protein YijF (DUF1287 family)
MCWRVKFGSSWVELSVCVKKPSKPKAQKRRPATPALHQSAVGAGRQTGGKPQGRAHRAVAHTPVDRTPAGPVLSAWSSFFEGLNGTPPPPLPRAKPRAAVYTSDDRQILALLSLPVVAVMMAFGLTQATKLQRYGDLAARPAPPPATVSSPRAPATVAAPAPAVVLGSAPPVFAPVAPAPASAALKDGPSLALAPPPPLSLAPSVAVPFADQPTVSASGAQASSGLGEAARVALPPPLANRSLPAPGLTGEVLDLPKVAMLAPPVAETQTHSAEQSAVREAPEMAAVEPRRGAEVCVAPVGVPVAPLSANASPGDFGQALARAARSQTTDLVIYNDKYRRIAFPMGDVPALYGVCTDVVIRAYRALGIDLQQLVHDLKVGAGDTNIDHRRTETLRRFFARAGESLAITRMAEDYLPGDIVTYYRPQNRHSRSHIAVVSDVIAPSGRYMILHNRGWGVQLEDGLFVDEITGHYRYRAPTAAPVQVARLPAVRPKLPAALGGRDGLAQTPSRAATLSQIVRRKAGAPDAIVSRQEGSTVRGLGR